MESDKAKPLSIDPLLVRIEDAATLLALSRAKLYQMMDCGELRYVKYGASRRIAVAVLREWIERHTR